MAQSVQKVQKTVQPDTINMADKYYRALQSMKGKHPRERCREGEGFSYTIYGIYCREKPKAANNYMRLNIYKSKCVCVCVALELIYKTCAAAQ